ncbi:hypothetical protein E1180_20060 [Roseibium denhamense]|uniref:Uncharacterized protein n=1 Tax=Roseibium denhamense TaxID=76305 RepID=A0ABY1PEU8_9HYPH|nr:hypothetical protein [Roseibium denhamense]MTI07802.1 hypothetical protein [Roseibium denhamense]SMP32087.1 hypothetical protein SAMN06265374_3467 [Roseibium denhamense]
MEEHHTSGRSAPHAAPDGLSLYEVEADFLLEDLIDECRSLGLEGHPALARLADALEEVHTRLEGASIEDLTAQAERTALMAVSEDLIILLAQLENLRDLRA